MRITVGGEKRDVDEALTIRKLIEIDKVETPEYVTVSVNEEFISKDVFDSYSLKDGDEVEFLYFMGGGR
ncbi:sulfur carrier protein ThiS [Butyrivibrio sp. CB08]|uniref:sulfur carrier protein ThiS n=1 Tax=Butyrivibrio sp. CB08 TaxID=2364879 RepID=UPI000EAA686B|nr:sulfur carrier protein ThiS [Butyrivibrio sp. CB08]RKM57601.1 sulfur carrier protein ThiS [Butyrivibrio sp. CB08]